MANTFKLSSKAGVTSADVIYTVATSTYGEEICAAVAQKNLWATQFHPEKSGETGLQVLRNFLRLAGR